MKKSNGHPDKASYGARVAGVVIGIVVLLAVVVVVLIALISDREHQSQVLNLCCDVIKITLGAAVGCLFRGRIWPR